MSETQSPYKVSRPTGSDKADEVFEFICAYKQANDGTSPTYRDICAGLDISSTSVVRYYLDNLVLRQKIKLTVGNQRGITVIGGRWTYAE